MNEEHGPSVGRAYQKKVKAMATTYTTEFFTYVFPVTSIANSTSSTVTKQLDTDAAFEWIKSEFFADISGAVQTSSSQVLPLVTVQFTDGATNRNMFSEAVPIPTVAGPTGLPFIMPESKIFAPGATIVAQFANYSSATTYANLYFLMLGRKLY